MNVQLVGLSFILLQVSGFFQYSASSIDYLESRRKQKTIGFETCTLFGEGSALTFSRQLIAHEAVGFGAIPTMNVIGDWRVISVICGSETRTDPFNREREDLKAGGVLQSRSCEDLLHSTGDDRDSPLIRETLRVCHHLGNLPLDDDAFFKPLLSAETSKVPVLDKSATSVLSFALAHFRKDYATRGATSEIVSIIPETPDGPASCRLKATSGSLFEATVLISRSVRDIKISELVCGSRAVELDSFHVHIPTWVAQAATESTEIPCPVILDIPLLCAAVSDLFQVPHRELVEAGQTEICDLRGGGRTSIKLQRPYQRSPPRWTVRSVDCAGNIGFIADSASMGRETALGKLLSDIEMRFNRNYSNRSLSNLKDFLELYAYLGGGFIKLAPSYCNALRLHFGSGISLNEICRLAGYGT